MEEQYITFETAKLAKEKKFIYPTLANYECEEDGTVKELNWKFKTLGDFLDNLNTPVCTQSLLQKWLREIHNIHIVITLEFSESLKELWYYGLLSIKGNEINELGDEGYTTYELALEAGLKEALTLI